MIAFSCINCASNQSSEIAPRCRDSNEFKIVKCMECGLIQLDHMPNISEDQDFYDADQQVKNCISELTLQEMKNNAQSDNIRRYAMIQPYLNVNKEIIEIGCGYGFFLEFLQEKGVLAEGIEIGEERRSIANQFCNNRVHSINLLSEQKLCNSKKFDIICLFQVLEHISNPVLFLSNINKAFMSETSELIIEVPNVDDQMLKISDAYFDFYWQRAHLIYYRKKTLEIILNKAGFEVKKAFGIQRYGLENNFNWIINSAPQLKKPVYQSKGSLKWLEDYYKTTIEQNMTADTLIVIAKKILD